VAGLVAAARRTLSPIARPSATPTSFPEIDCIRHLLPIGFAEIAEWRSVQVGLGADRVLIAAGHVAEETYLRALASSLRIGFEPLDDASREDCPLPDHKLPVAAVAGFLPLYVGGERCYVLAPRGLAARSLERMAQTEPATLARFRLTSTERLTRYALVHGRSFMGDRAANWLKAAHPLYSAATRSRTGRLSVAMLLASSLFTLVAPAMTMTVLGIALSTFFLVWAAFRVAATCVSRSRSEPTLRIADADLPVYTIVVALYHEADVVADLVKALRKFDYPQEKVQTLLVLESDDSETRRAIERLRPGLPFEIVVAPDVGPRTKPKALNVALSLARGTYTAIYDAEDRPEPGQLRAALAAFTANPVLACVQGRLTIDNTADGWLTRGIMAQTPQGRHYQR
jgi:hypothetical protein